MNESDKKRKESENAIENKRKLPSATVFVEKELSEEHAEKIRKANRPHANVPWGMD